MLIQLTPPQARVIGVLLEKEITTPDQYPLSLNSLTLGCNQKSSRDPVMELAETEVQDIIDELKVKKLIFEHSGIGSRVVKYKHRFCNTEFSDLKFNRQQLAVVCVLLLRGAQTPGELRTRTNRLADFADTNEVEVTLAKLHDLNDEKIVMKLERKPGRRDSQYAHLFCGDAELHAVTSFLNKVETIDTTSDISSNPRQTTERIMVLEQQVADLTQQVAELKELVDLLTE